MDLPYTSNDPLFGGLKKGPLKRKNPDVDPEAPELHPEKRRRLERSEEGYKTEKSDTCVETFCTKIKRDSHENQLKRKRSDDSHEGPEPHPKELVEKKRKIKENVKTKKRCLQQKEAEFFKRYSMQKLLGQGGYGAVFAGNRNSDGKKVALKFMKKPKNHTYVALPGDTRRLPREVALMELVCKPPNCPNIIELLDWHETSDALILVLERPDPCVDLFDYANDGHISENKAKIIMEQVVSAARHCRDRGVFHRDIKDENILVNPRTLEVKLIDFGCGVLHQDTPYTHHAGTKTYFPPEWFAEGQCEAEPATVWSLGVLLYTILCRQNPFEEEEDIVAGNLSLPDYLSEACCSLICWCLERDPKKRPTLDQILRHIWF